MKIAQTVKDTLAERRAAREARETREAVERELASYQTPAERLELDMILARHTDEETAEVRNILDRQAI